MKNRISLNDVIDLRGYERMMKINFRVICLCRFLNLVSVGIFESHLVKISNKIALRRIENFFK